MTAHFIAVCVSLFLLGVVPTSLAQEEHVQVALRQGTIRTKGVNLGGWLVAERWMTYDSVIWKDVPAGVADAGEYVTMKYLGHTVGDQRFEEHRASWITERDIAEIARRGLNAVRVPVGFWIRPGQNASSMPFSGQRSVCMDHDPAVYAPGALKYLDQLINSWAVRHNVAVVISLHSHQGSQNGRDHGAPPSLGVKEWSVNQENVENSVELATFLAERYRSSSAFLGMSLLNEPELPTNPATILAYYTRVHALLRGQGNDCVLVTAPLLRQQSPEFMSDFLKGATNVWHEWHPYYKWGFEGAKEDAIIAAATAYGQKVLQWNGNPLLISEWSMGVWETSAPFTDADQFRQFGQAEQGSFQGAKAGSFFWSWRHSDDIYGKRSGWSMRGLLRAGLLTV